MTRISANVAVAGGGTPASNWLHYLSLAVAGGASFAIAVSFFQVSTDENKVVLRGHVQKTMLPSHPGHVGATPGVGDNFRQEILHTSAINHDPNNYSHDDMGPVRLSASVLQSPFDVLNLSASINPPALPAITAAGRPVRKRKALAPPAAPMVARESPSPTAPALPFSVIGSIQGARIGDGKQMAFLNRNGVFLVVHAADLIDGVYRVESIHDNAIEFTYLPLNQKQVLPVPH